MEERRRFVRLDTSVKVKYRILAPSIGALDSNSRDLSIGGVRIEVKDSIQPKTLLGLEISMPGETEILRAKGEVVWQEKISAPEHIRYEIGIKFLEMNLNDRNRLNKYLFGLLHNKFEQKSN